jgi:peptide/nickel transport system permease protein
MTFGQRLDSQTLEETKRNYGLDLPLNKQLARYFRDLSPINIIDSELAIIEEYNHVHLFSIGKKDVIIKSPYLRQSYQSGRDVSDILIEAVPLTIALATASMLLATPLGLLLGLLSARFPNTVLDHSLLTFSVLGYSVPSYVSALFFSIIFGYWLGDMTGLPIQGSLIELDNSGNEVFKFQHLILPALALGIRPIAVIMQITRTTMIDELSKNYIKTARSKGLKEYVVVVKHALRNAANPITTTVSGWFAALIAGSFFVESIFNYHGIGSVTVNALLMFDVPLLLGAIIVISTLYVLINIATDIAYSILDVRVKLK